MVWRTYGGFLWKRYLHKGRGELSYLAPLGSEKFPPPISSSVSAESKTTPPSPKTEITNILFYILNFSSIIKFKM
jgi:hypothetical protein